MPEKIVETCARGSPDTSQEICVKVGGNLMVHG